MIASPPLHPLVVHLPLVALPVASIGAIILASRTSLTRRWGIALTALTGTGAFSAILATQTGEDLEESFRDRGQSISQTLRDHAELGELARALGFGLLVVVTTMWVLGRRDYRWRRPWMMPLLRLTVITISIAVAYVTYRTGHTGATSVWND